MDSRSFNFLPGKSGFGFSYLDTNCLARRVITSNNTREDSLLQFPKIDVKHKINKPCQTIPGNNLVDHVKECKKNTCQIKNYKHTELLPQVHLNMMSGCSSFLIGGYVGSKSQKENAHRSRINVQIQDFILSKIFHIMGNAVQNVTKCSTNLEKTGDYAFNLSCTEKNSYRLGLTNIENQNPSISKCMTMNSSGKQSYADVAKTSVSELPLNKFIDLKSENIISKVIPMDMSQTTQFPNSQIKCTSSKTNKNFKRNFRHRSIIDDSLHFEKSGKSSDDIYFRQNKQRNEKKSGCTVESCNYELQDSSGDSSNQKMSVVPAQKYKEKPTCVMGISEISIPILETGIDFVSGNITNKNIDDIGQNNIGSEIITNFLVSENSSPENISNDSVSAKNLYDVQLDYRPFNNIPISISPNQDLQKLNRNRAVSECSIDSEDSFIVFACDCDETNDNHIEETDDTIWSDDSCFSDDGLCNKDCSRCNEDKIGFCSSSNKTGTKEKKKVRFSDKVQVHRMIAWNYAHRKARMGPWETYARDSARFRNRISQLSSVLNPILSRGFRQRIFLERFSSSEV